MSKIPSASTVSVNVFLTEIGRDYLIGFNSDRSNRRYDPLTGADLLEIKTFSLYDSDVNYRSINPLEPGDLPNLSGSKINSCLNTITKRVPKNRIIK
jgi:hypothetical protein